MRIIIALIASLALSGCATNGEFDGKKTATLIGTMLVVGYVAAEQADSGGGNNNVGQNCYIVVGPNGSYEVCK